MARVSGLVTLGRSVNIEATGTNAGFKRVSASRRLVLHLAQVIGRISTTRLLCL